MHLGSLNWEALTMRKALIVSAASAALLATSLGAPAELAAYTALAGLILWAFT